MREERGQIVGQQTIFETYNLWGKIAGNVRVIQRGKLYVRGAVYGDLHVEYMGRCHIYGQVSGDLVVDSGAKVIHSGIVGGSVINRGGRIYIDGNAKVIGQIRTNKGKTTVEPKFYDTPGNKKHAEKQ
jgi:cytoskeletal protein CcmA (bactofilin family)